MAGGSDDRPAGRSESGETFVIEHIDRVATMDDAGHELRDAFIVIEAGRIRAVGQGEPPPLPPGSRPRVLLARGLVATPGLINTHHHLFQNLTRTLPTAQDRDLEGWLAESQPWWEHLDEEAVYWAALAGLSELALSGCSTSVDHMFAVPVDSAGLTALLSAEARAARELGVRIHLMAGSVDPGLHPDGGNWRLAHRGDRVLAEMERAVHELHDPSPDATCQVGLAPDSLTEATTGLMRDVRDLARRYGVLRHTHASQTTGEVQYCRERYGRTPIERLASLGWIEDDVFVAHAVRLTSQDIAALAGGGTGVAHCPSSNMRLGAGAAPTLSLLDAGVHVGLGVDGSGSNDVASLLAEVRMAMLLSRVREGTRLMTARQALALAIRHGAEVVHRAELGRIAVGAQADIALFRLDGVAAAGTEHDPVAALALAPPRRVHHLFVGGRPVVAGGRLATVDEAQVRAGHRASLASLRRRVAPPS